VWQAEPLFWMPIQPGLGYSMGVELVFDFATEAGLLHRTRPHTEEMAAPTDRRHPIGFRSAVTLHWLCVLLPGTPAGDLGVHCVRRQIDLTGPRNRAAINEDPFEELHIRQGSQRTGQFFWPQPHTSR